MATIGIVDYGLGNLRSVRGAVERLGHEAQVTADADALAAADRLILPGVGAFGDGMKNLRARGLDTALTALVRDGKPILGICLGFQLLARGSTEFGEHEGLGWVPAHVERLAPADTTLRVPHVGWNDLEQTKASPLYDDVPAEALFYYVHSYRMVADSDEIVVGRCDYGGPFVAAIAHGNIFGVQFHPEKSQAHGLTLLGNFLDLPAAAMVRDAA